MIETKRCFISGPMTGIEDFNRPAFMAAEEALKLAGFSVFNPAWMNFDGGFDNDAIMAIDLVALSHCNYIYQLDGWAYSKGASAEWNAALAMGIKSVSHEWLDWYLGTLEKKALQNLAEEHVVLMEDPEEVFGDEPEYLSKFEGEWQQKADEMNKARVDKLKAEKEVLEKATVGWNKENPKVITKASEYQPSKKETCFA